MRKVVITAGDCLTCLGDSQQTWQGLLAGKSGISLQNFGHLEGAWPLGFIPGLSSEVGSLERQDEMLERLLKNVPPLPPHTKLFCATTKAATDELLLRTGRNKGQAWQMADQLAEQFGIEAGSTVSAACVSSLIAIIQGAMRISTGECNHALIVGFDLVSQFVLSGFSSLKALTLTSAKPFDCNRDGLALSDGAGWMLLAAEDVTEPSEILATPGPWSMSCDANHITAPSRNATGLTSALRDILSQTEAPIGGIHAHGTATVFNDAMELLAFQNCFPTGIPVCSVKGALGHSLAASGIIETIMAIHSLHEMVLPPTIGLETPSKSSCTLSGNSTLPLLHPTVITCNSGFGGINAALLLKNI
ncbi:beta-ketoacyl synthase [Desulforhopalus vacuolatus]|uniref:beta-ketoacyl synthase N-terminal-like domain-containing protein n=1 Tax=Desulforhopalus vacuolatus TaxID=40414 RepID=UPI0019636B81|nr:beta-ketoacyl synthase N-terminal-like domain-containing protein [Desulforhopalus vacuolatus]MBM9519736.1 beta-ketoacyl synthase [Desulforhopalus vacuolatus]